MQTNDKTYIDFGFTGLAADQQVVVLDIETTGLDPENDEIIEVKLLKCRLDAPIDRLFDDNETFDQRYYAAGPMSPGAFAVHHIHLSTLEDAPALAAAAHAIRDFIGNAPVISHHVGFAQAFLSNAFIKAGVEPLSANRGYCTLYRLREHTGLMDGDWFRRSQEAAADYLGVDTCGYSGDQRWAPLILKLRMARLWQQWDDTATALPAPKKMKKKRQIYQRDDTHRPAIAWQTALFALGLIVALFLLFK
jgi:hypothetical protein